MSSNPFNGRASDGVDDAVGGHNTPSVRATSAVDAFDSSTVIVLQGELHELGVFVVNS